MNQRASRFVGLAIAFVAGSFASSPAATAQGNDGASVVPAGVFDAAMRSGISGVVRDRRGRPQIGALVELLNARFDVVARTFTDDRGRYTLPRLSAGVYQVKASNALSLPTVRPDLQLLVHSRVIVNLTLSTLYQALQWFPAQPKNEDSAPDDWSWTLRMSANRPLLRMLKTSEPGSASEPVLIQTDNGTSLPGNESAAGRGPGEKLVVRSGGSSFGQGGAEQQIVWQDETDATRSVLLAATAAASGSGLGRISTSAAYRQELTPDRSMLTVVTLTDRPRIASATESGLATMRVRSASTLQMGDLATISTGTEIAAARMGDAATVLASHPFVTVETHAGGATIRYQMITAPTTTGQAEMLAEASDDTPSVVQVAGRLRFQQGLHQELSISGSSKGRGGSQGGTWTGTVAIFHDSLAHPVVEGAMQGEAAALDSSDVLYDPGTGTIAVSGRGYSSGGVMAMLHNQLNKDTWLSFRYALGDANTLALPAGNADGPQFGLRETSMISAAAGTRIPATHTVVRGSYRWQPVSTLTEIAPFAEGTPGAYLGVSIRQPLHLQRLGTGKLEAILDVRNLLAEGYRPFLSQDGGTVFFAQQQRCIAAGIGFTF